MRMHGGKSDGKKILIIPSVGSRERDRECSAVFAVEYIFCTGPLLSFGCLYVCVCVCVYS